MKTKFRNYELYSLSFIILNLDIFILLNSLIPIYNLDTVKVFIYVIELIPLFCLSRHLCLYIKIKSEMKELKNKYNILFISLTLALLIYALIINTTYSYFHEGGFNSLILLLNIILLVIHNVLFLYYENKGKDNEKIKEYNDLILTNSLINKDNEENKKNSFKIHTLYYLLALVPGTIFSASYFYMILKTESYDLGYIFSNFTFLSVLIIISLLIYIVILVILGLFSYKNKFYKPYKIILIPVINILSLVLMCLVAFYIKEFTLEGIINDLSPNNGDSVIGFLTFIIYLFYLLLFLLVSPFNIFDSTYLSNLRKNNKIDKRIIEK